MVFNVIYCRPTYRTTVTKGGSFISNGNLLLFLLYRGLTLDEALKMIENDEHNDIIDVSNQISLTALPPTNACDDVTDEDSGDENIADLDNLPGSQLRTETEIELFIESEHTERVKARGEKVVVGEGRQDENGDMKRKKTYHWEKCDLSECNNE